MVKVSKKYDRDFTIIQNSFFKFNEKLPKEEKLGFKEAGIFWYLWHLPNNWEFHESEIVNHFKDKIDSFRTGRQKLEKYGFIKKVRNRNKQGQVGAYQWILDDDPKFEPGLDFPKQGKSYYGKNLYRKKPTQENPHLQSTNSTNNESNKELNATTTAPLGIQNVLKFYQENIGMIPPIVTQSIQMWCKDLPPEMVQEAIKRAAESNRTWRYAEGILRSWIKRNINTMDKVKADDVSFSKSHEPQHQRKSSAKKKVESYGQGEYAAEKAKADRGEIPF